MRRKKSIVKVEIKRALPETEAAIRLIKRMSSLNKLYFDLSIAYDFSLRDYGEYHQHERYQKNRIFINPLICEKVNDELLEPFCPGYVSDVSNFGVTIHEFCHFLQFQVYPTLVESYKATFATERFFLNKYSNHEILDEIAEVMTLYITNPYLLRLISKDHYKFFLLYFKSPVPCSFQRAKRIYEKFPIIVKAHLKKTFGIVYNINNESFEKTPIDSNIKNEGIVV
jgi:hypothetical protein